MRGREERIEGVNGSRGSDNERHETWSMETEEETESVGTLNVRGY